jgi:hypothetical protein
MPSNMYRCSFFDQALSVDTLSRLDVGTPAASFDTIAYNATYYLLESFTIHEWVHDVSLS